MTQSEVPGTAPFADWVGIREVSSRPGHVTVALELRPELTNRLGSIHGGVVATLLDSAMARAARSLDSETLAGGTVDLHIHYMRPGTGSMEATAWVEHHTRSTAFCRGEVRDGQGALVASGACTLRLKRRQEGD